MREDLLTAFTRTRLESTATSVCRAPRQWRQDVGESGKRMRKRGLGYGTTAPTLSPDQG